jgi:4-deoxy-L-threo-5-hexosulose-uronate ketol-isomerase
MKRSDRKKVKHVEQRHATAPQQVPSMTTDDLWRHYLVEDLFTAAHSHRDR